MKEIEQRVRKLFSNQPPDLDELFNKWVRKLNDFLSGKPSRSNSKIDPQWSRNNGDDSDDNNAPPFQLFSSRSILIFVASASFIWFALGFYIVDEKERAVVLRFGALIKTNDPGVYWAPPIVDRPFLVNVKQVRSTSYSTTLLTGDENIIKIEYEVQYIVSNAEQFLFEVNEPEKVLGEVVNSTVREIVGRNDLDYVLLEGRAEVASIALDLAKNILDSYKIGISLQNINILEAQPPEEVQSAFNDANKAREDKQRYINEAEAYQNEVVPVARGDAKQIVESAKAYKSRVVSKAEGDAARFTKVLAEYKRAPAVTKTRLWIETLEDVYYSSTKVYISNPKSNQLLYLPLDQLKKKIDDARTRAGSLNNQSAQGTQIPRGSQSIQDSQQQLLSEPNRLRIRESR